MDHCEFLVSVIIPVFNGEKYLASAIESVFSQTYSPLELIVVDDGSTDESGAIAKQYKDIHYIYQSHQGVSVARNTGLAAANGAFIAFLDADDMWLSPKLQIQIDYLLEHPAVMYVITKIHNFLEPGTDIPPPVLQSIVKNEQIQLSSIVARKAVFDRIGGFNPLYQVTEDFEWITRTKDAGISMVILPEVLSHRRIHDSNISITQRPVCKAMRMRAIKESVGRRRSKKEGDHGQE